MTNLELLKLQYPLIEQNWDLITAVSLLPLVIIADRSGIESVNIKISSSDLPELWARSSRQGDIPQHILKLASNSNYLVVDVTALWSTDQSVRFYAYARDFVDYITVITQWQWLKADGYILGIGLYHNLPLNYKYYVVSDLDAGIVKEKYINHLVSDAPYSDKEKYSPEFLSQHYENLLPTTPENVAIFKLEQLGLNLNSVSIVQKEDKTQSYLTVWN